MDEVVKAFETSRALLLASENWSNGYDKAPMQHAQLLKVDARLERKILQFFKDVAKQSDSFINWYAYDYAKRGVTASRVDAYDVSVIVDDTAVAGTDNTFITVVFEDIALATALGSQAGEVIYDIPLGISPTDADIQRIAHQHVAKLVGKRITNDGSLIDNPSADYRISDKTRADIRQSIQTSINLGEDVQAASARLQDTIKNIGKSRAQIIANTETVNSYNAGLVDFGTKSKAIGKEWEDNNADDICAQYASLGPIPFSQTYDGLDGPTAHPNCLIGSSKVDATSIKSATRRFYKGQVVRIVTASGNKLTVTPNHPILTSDGWIAAGKLTKGSHVISSQDGQRITSVINPNDYHVKTSIKKIYKSFADSGSVTTRTVPTTPKDFHGDGAGSKVAVIRADSHLRSSINTAFPKPNLQQKFISACSKLFNFSRLSPLNLFSHSMLATSGGLISSFGVKSSLFRRPTVSEEPISVSDSPDGHVVDFEELGDDLTAATELPRKLSNRFSGGIVIDDIVSLRRYPFIGHVYNLQTDIGWYIGNNIVTHNCRCNLRLIYQNELDDNPDLFGGDA